MSCGTTRLTKSTGMANPTPAEAPVFVKMAVLTPSRPGLVYSRTHWLDLRARPPRVITRFLSVMERLLKHKQTSSGLTPRRVSGRLCHETPEAVQQRAARVTLERRDVATHSLTPQTKKTASNDNRL